MQKEDPAAGAELGCPGKAPALYLEMMAKAGKSVTLEDKHSLHGCPGPPREKPMRQVGQPSPDLGPGTRTGLGACVHVVGQWRKQCEGAGGAQGKRSHPQQPCGSAGGWPGAGATQPSASTAGRARPRSPPRLLFHTLCGSRAGRDPRATAPGQPRRGSGPPFRSGPWCGKSPGYFPIPEWQEGTCWKGRRARHSPLWQ